MDVLVANAAVPASGPVLEFTEEQIDRALDVNLRAPILLAHHLAPDDGASAAAGTSSSSRRSPARSPHRVRRSTARRSSALRGFGLGLREDLRPAGVGVSTVFPGFIRDAGMFADSGAELPGYVGTRTPDDVAGAVLRAIDKDIAELDVAPLSMRLGAKLTGLAPAPMAAIQRRLGSEGLASAIADGQIDKR